MEKVQTKKLIARLMQNQLSPIPEIANSACVSPDILKFDDKGPTSKSAKVISPSSKTPKKPYNANFIYKKQIFNDLKTSKNLENQKRLEKEPETCLKPKILKISKVKKTGKFIIRESPKRTIPELKFTQKSGSVQRIKNLVNTKDTKIPEKLNKNEGLTQFLGRRKQKALTHNCNTARNYDANSREVEEILSKFSRNLIQYKFRDA